MHQAFRITVSLLRPPPPLNLPQAARVWGCPFPKEIFIVCLPSAWHQDKRFWGTGVRGNSHAVLVCETTRLPAPERLMSQGEK